MIDVRRVRVLFPEDAHQGGGIPFERGAFPRK
jgi:hypothetical protein